VRRAQRAGFTLIEVIAAGAIAAVIAGGSMLAYVAAARMMRQGDTPAIAEASGFAQQTIERFRNMIACNSNWFDPADCAPRPFPPNAGGMPVTWVEDPLPAWDASNTQSILNPANGTSRRCFQVVSQSCDVDAALGDCFRIDVQVCWNGGACPC
jgi:prepilin-type N-terminal cleavage/methylation domain-containing protein